MLEQVPEMLHKMNKVLKRDLALALKLTLDSIELQMLHRLERTMPMAENLMLVQELGLLHRMNLLLEQYSMLVLELKEEPPSK
jgi:hypothetical protein